MPLNDWHDFIRVLGFITSVYCVLILIVRWKDKHDTWNTKTLDYWYALLMWSLAGAVFTAQGIALDRPITPGFVFLIAAILVTVKGLAKKGSWGGS